MGRYNEATLLAQFEHDSVTNSLQVPDSLAFPPTSGTGYPITTVAAYSGPTAIQITDILVSFGDIVVTDPASDLFLGWALWTASDFGASPTYASLLGYTANADLPHIHDNSESTTAIQAVVNAPVSLLNYIGAGGNLVYATQALQPAGRKLPATSPTGCPWHRSIRDTGGPPSTS